jgi:hypothetical protein
MFLSPVVSETIETQTLEHLRAFLGAALIRVEGHHAPRRKILRRIDAGFGFGRLNRCEQGGKRWQEKTT